MSRVVLMIDKFKYDEGRHLIDCFKIVVQMCVLEYKKVRQFWAYCIQSYR